MIKQLLWITLVLTACRSEVVNVSFEDVSTPAGDFTLYPNLISHKGELYLSWVEEKHPPMAELKYARLVDGEWTESRTIAKDSTWFINWADFPSVFPAEDGSLTAHFLAKSGPGVYDYDVRVAHSEGIDSKWSFPGKPYSDTTKAEHGFVSIFDQEGNTGMVWLDGRMYKKGDERMTLRTAVLKDGQWLGEDVLLDEKICDCCQTGAAKTEDGVVIVYRNRTYDEIRDIYRILYRDGKWSDPAPVANDNWNIAGCPVNGPSIDAVGNEIAVGWFTGAKGVSAVKLAFSQNGGDTFSEPVRIDKGNPIGRIDLQWDTENRVWVSWMENVGETDSEILLKAFDRKGNQLGEWAVATVKNARATGFPRLSLLEDTAYLAWTSADDTSRVIMKKIILPL